MPRRTAVVLSKGEHARMLAARIRLKALEHENDLLRAAIRDCWHMAGQYANEGLSHATAVFNGHTRALIGLDVEMIIGVEGPPWARDAIGPAYDGLTDAEAQLGPALERPMRLTDETVQRLDCLERVARAAWAVNRPDPTGEDWTELARALEGLGGRP